MSAALANAPSNEELQLVSQSVSNSLQRTELSVPDMHCGACIGRIEKALVALDGVTDVRVNLTNKRVSVCWSNTIEPSSFVQQLITLGFHPVLPTEQARHTDLQLSAYLRALAVSGFAAGNVMLLSVSVWSGADPSTRLLFHWLSALITIPAVLYAGRFFFRSAWYAVRSGKSNMDVPITVGILLACTMSLYDTITHAERVYFEAAIMLVFFLLIGRTVDHLVRNKASSAIDGLHALEPAGAQRLTSDGQHEFVKTADLNPGDMIIVQAGVRIPADGTVVSGISDINSELVDGESLPKTIATDQAVFSGTLNLTAALEIKITANAEDSFLASVQRLVQYGEGNKGTYRRLADKVSDWYTPFVHGSALMAFFWWYFNGGNVHQSLSIAISVLIITCPCALALAVPMVQTIAAQRLFASGIVMKNGAALEKLNQIDTIVFDKTGTLTDGMPVVSGESSVADHTLALAQRLAVHSEHPFAKAIMRLSQTNISSINLYTEVPIDNVKDLPGCGIEAKLGLRTVRLGKHSWACDTTSSSKSKKHSHSESVLSIDGAVVANFEFEHRLRADANHAVAQLKEQVPHVLIVSGDSSAPVQSIAAKLAIAPTFSNYLPADKLNKILTCEEQGNGVLMIGDGLNDAGAMAAATVSMAPAKAASVSRTVADFVFLRPSLMAIPEVIDVADQARIIIRQNIAIALIYNLIALPVAFAGLVTPLLAAIAMSTSSILVVCNALRISQNKYRTKDKLAPPIAGVAA